MATDAQKQQFLQAVRETMGDLARLCDRAETISTAYTEREYDSAAADAITVDQVASFGVGVYYIGAAVSLCNALKTLLDDPTNRATVSRWRQV